MEEVLQKKRDIDKYIEDKDYTANKYVMRCFFVSMFVYFICFLLNLFDIFIVDKRIMLRGFIPSVIIYLTMVLITKNVSLSSDKIKYFILLSIVVVFTFIGVTITYHVVIIAVLPILYSILYSSKRVLWYVYGLTVVSTIIIVYAGYFYGVCDANMAVLTNTSIDKYLINGHFQFATANDNIWVTLMLFFVIPRCLIYIALMAVCSSIFKFIRAGLDKAQDFVKMEDFQKELKSKVYDQTVELCEQQRKLNETYLQTVTALSEAVDAKDRYTSGHSKRVAEYSRIIAKRMGKNNDEQQLIYRAGLLHDVGKIGVPVDIINKPGRLTDSEFDLIKIHPITGYHILRQISEYSEIAIAAKYHHEHYNGKGYPNGLSGENIPETARILGVADAYDAMTSNRSYRKGLPQDIVRAEIEKGKGRQFDPVIADIMLQMIDEDKEYKLRQIDREDYKILVIGEDEENNQRIKDILEEEKKYEVIIGTYLDEVVQNVERNSIDMIIWDIKMNQENGWEILERIKQIYRIPIVLVSDDSDLRSTNQFREFGCDDYITKSFGPLMIKEIVYNLIKKRK